MAKYSITRAQSLAYAIAVLNGENVDESVNISDVIESLKRQLGAIEKASASAKSGEKTETKSHKILVSEAQLVYDWMAESPNLARSNRVIRDTFPQFMTSQKVTALMNVLVRDGRVVKSVEKGVTYYKIAPIEE